MPRVPAAEVIAAKGGVLLDTFWKIKGPRKQLYASYLCANGHHNSKPENRVAVRWCWQCYKLDVQHADDAANKLGGTFLEVAYINTGTKYHWRCALGHVFRATYNNVVKGHWCPTCRKIPIEYFQDLASSKGGRCLSDSLTTVTDTLRFSCAENHEWDAVAANVRYGSWCPKCQEAVCERTCRKVMEHVYDRAFPKAHPTWLRSRAGTQLELDGYCEDLGVAFEYNGAQHYEFVPFWHKTLNRLHEQQKRDADTIRACDSNGVTLLVIPYTVPYAQLGSWIIEHAPRLSTEMPTSVDYEQLDLQGCGRDKLNEALRLALLLDPEAVLLSDIYVDGETPVRFRCGSGHEIKQTTRGLRDGRFCALCSRLKKAYQQISEFTRHTGWELVSAYTRNKDVVEWRCVHCARTVNRCWSNMKQHLACGCV